MNNVHTNLVEAGEVPVSVFIELNSDGFAFPVQDGHLVAVSSNRMFLEEEN